jgi:curved DNA-binding protein CbpA
MCLVTVHKRTGGVAPWRMRRRYPCLDSGVGQDPFDVLGLGAGFDLSQSEIDAAYFRRAAALHPDVAAARPEAAGAMAALNRAKDVLSSPERRADALILRLGGPGRDQHKQLPPSFLAEIMEVREQVEEALALPRDQRSGARDRWERWAEAERAKAISEVSAMFAGLGSPPSAAALADIRSRLNAWRYIERLIEQLDPDYDSERADFDGPNR